MTLKAPENEKLPVNELTDETTGGETSGELPVDELPVDELPVDELPVDELTVDETAGETTGEATGGETAGDKAAGDTKAGRSYSRRSGASDSERIILMSTGGKRLKGKKEAEDRPAMARAGRRPRRRLTKLEIIILLIPAAAALVAVLAVYLITRDTMRIVLEGAPCQYYGGNIYRIEEGAVLRRTSDGETLLKTSAMERSLTSLPIYYEDRTSITFPEDMVYYSPRDGTYGRIEYFTELTYDTVTGVIKAKRDGGETRLKAGFLYDGGDMYIFLEPVILSFNGYRLELPALSYVEAVYTGDVMVFNYDSKEFLIEAPEGAVTAMIEAGDYTVSLLGDSMELYDGSRSLLFTRPELLDTVGEE